MMNGNLSRMPGKCVLASLLCSVTLFFNASLVQAAGANRQALTTSHLRVCADPDNLPFSNKAGEGLENKIITLIAEKMGLEVRYTWFPQSTGFVRNTLRVRQCDLVSGITTTSEKVQNTNPYYHSAYSIVYRKGEDLDISSISDKVLAGLRLGVVAGTPPADLLARNGLLGNLKPYQLLADTRVHKPARQAVVDVAEGVTDVAFIWGPIAGYYAKQLGDSLLVKPLSNEDPRVRMNYRVSMAVRFNETDWKHKVNEVLAELQPQIDQILKSYGVPLLNNRGEWLAGQ